MENTQHKMKNIIKFFSININIVGKFIYIKTKERNLNSPWSQCLPFQNAVHVHLYAPAEFVHVAPLRQGLFLVHSLMSSIKWN